MARLDTEIVSRGIARSRERAKEMIKSGCITINGKSVSKASCEVGTDDIIESSEQEIYVGRGALKIEKATETFGLDFTGKTCLDIGASTGGFTDFMLKNGAEKVFAVDVGHGQLAPSLRADSRVINMENTDIRKVTPEMLGCNIDFISTDVSFISLKIILPEISRLLKAGADAVVLIKPQFEAGRKFIGKHGIVRDKKVHVRVLSEIDAAIYGNSLTALDYTFSSIKGGSGNIEYLAHLRKISGTPVIRDFRNLVEISFTNLKE
ncbi:MAG: TlyA family RNA methyltransferase [Prevotella sp.]|nr:TlyA family RNA methyltransferase [Alistipes senegalensis]MCM1358438.1 TlyA family RNA methyltransferase [Prevotella sp.]MCM1473510.1 TlyA family RNA methyltransferase [Muribaculaceae bacterium]